MQPGVCFEAKTNVFTCTGSQGLVFFYFVFFENTRFPMKEKVCFARGLLTFFLWWYMPLLEKKNPELSNKGF
jgi:hypothetical protein